MTYDGGTRAGRSRASGEGADTIGAGVVWTVFQAWGQSLINLLVFVVLARLLDPKAFGLLALAHVYTQFSAIFVDQGFGAAIVQRENLERGHLSAAFWGNLGLGVTFAGIGVAVSGAVAAVFGEPALGGVVAWLSLNFILQALAGVPEALLQRNLRFRVLAVRSTMAALAGGVAAIVMAVRGFGVYSLVGQQLVFSATSAVLLWKLSGWFPCLRVSRAHFHHLTSFGIRIVGIRILGFLSKRSDDLIVGYFLGPVALGLYSVAYKLMKILLDLLTKVVAKVSFPAFARLQADPAALRRAFYRATGLSATFAFPCFATLALAAPIVVGAVFGSQWVASVPTMRLLALVGLAQCLMIVANQVLIASGRPGRTLALLAGITATSVTGFLLAVRGGIAAVALAYLVAVYLHVPAYVWVLRRDLGMMLRPLLDALRVPMKGTAAVAVAATVTAGALSGMAPPMVALLLVGGVVAGVYGVLLGRWGVLAGAWQAVRHGGAHSRELEGIPR